MFSASPSVRRKYLDSLFFQVDYKYKQAHSKYLKSLRQSNKLLEQLRDFERGKKQKEIYAKTTLVGPHRDDFKVFLAGFNLSSFGSRGQQRSTLLAIKLCEIDFITQITQKRPVLLLDDIFSELDEKHRGAILEVIHLQQTIITSAEPREHIEGFMKKVRFIKL